MQPIFILLILIGVFNSILKAAKKQTQATGTPQKGAPVPPAARSAARKPAPETAKKASRPAFPAQEKRAAQPAWKSGEGEDPCHEEMLRGVKPSGNEEGADPCHEYMLHDTPSAEDASAPMGEEQAQELLRGVIMSEILRRPRSVTARRTL